MDKFVLRNKVEIPAIGLGTYSIQGSLMEEVMLKAIEYGYRNFDTAPAYRNHEDIGRAIKKCKLSREEIFVTTKLSNIEQRRGDILGAFKRTLNFLGLDYIDLYLIHWPVPDLYLKSWIEIEKLYKQGLVRSIGVCNFHEHHINNLLNIADIAPMVNQIEIHPYLTQKPLIKFCQNLGIQVQAYSPLARMHEKLLNNKTLICLAEKYKKTIPQIILRWNYQNKIISIPKTQNFARLLENISIFDFCLLPEEINEIDQINENFRVRHNPDNCDFSKL